MQQALDAIQAMALTLWIGSMFGFAFLFAPLLFKLSPTRDLAGQVAGTSLARIDITGLVSSGVLLMVVLIQASEVAWPPLDLARLLLVVLMLALTVLSATTVRGRLETVRGDLSQPIDAYPEEDPRRAEYNRYHRVSVQLFSVVLLLGLALVVLTAIRA